jgi:hypothetical protein
VQVTAASSGHEQQRPGAAAAQATTASSRRERQCPVAAVVEATVACGRFEMRQRSEGQRSTSGFKAQVYLLVNQRIYLGRATWDLPHIFVGYQIIYVLDSSVNR